MTVPKIIASSDHVVKVSINMVENKQVCITNQCKCNRTIQGDLGKEMSFMFLPV